jgi:hypothetical protein
MNAAPLDLIVLKGLDGYLALVVSNGESLGFYTGETQMAAASQAALAVTGPGSPHSESQTGQADPA